jgi:hypothetical protein
MKIKSAAIILLLSFLLLYLIIACQDVYTHDVLDDSKIIPVVEGAIHSGRGPHHLSLHYARPYNTDRYTHISGAVVTVVDNFGNTFSFDDTGTGRYLCPKGRLYVHIGRSYYLHVELPDGTILESDPAVVPGTLRIERIFNERETREIIERTLDNEIKIRNENGIASYIVIDPDYPEKTFYRVLAFYLEHLYYYNVGLSYEYIDNVEWAIYNHSVYNCMVPIYENFLPKIGVFDPEASENEFARTKLCYFLPDTRTLANDTLQALGKYLTIKLYNISHDTYNYISAINDQLGSTAHLFDPIPTQIIGNMHCVNYPEQEVLGMFEVSSLYDFVPYEVDTFSGCVYEFWESRRIIE